MGRFLNADALVSTGQGLLGNNMFAYCDNSPVNKADPTGEFGILSTLAVAGIAISAVVGGLVAGASTALSGGSVGEVIASAAIGAVTAGAIATVAALGAAGTLTAGTVALVSGGIGAAGEVSSIAVEHAYHKNDENYTFDLATSTTRVIYAAGVSAFSGWVSYGINRIYTGADEIIGVCVSGETAVALGLVDFGIRQLISVANSSSSASSSPSRGGAMGSKQCVAIAY